MMNMTAIDPFASIIHVSDYTSLSFEPALGLLHRDDTFGVLTLEIQERGKFIASYDGWRIALYPESSSYDFLERGIISERYIRERIAHPFIRLLRGGILLHAGAVCTDAGGIGFLAPSGVGKSTITAGMLAFCGAKLISDDILTLCYDDENGGVLALPSSTHLAMRHGMFDHDGFVEKTNTTEYKRLLMVNPQQCAQKPCVPGALVIVRHSQEISLRKLSFAEALPHILAQQLTMSHAPEAFRRQQFRAITGWLSGIPCYILEMSCDTRQDAEAGICRLKQLAIGDSL